MEIITGLSGGADTIDLTGGKGKMSSEDTGLVPDGLDSAFYRWFQWFFPDIKEYEKNWQMPLACIAASPESIPEDEIKIVLDWTNTKLNKLNHTREVLLRKDVYDFKKDPLLLRHRYISEWLFSDTVGRYQFDREDAFWEMGAAFLELYNRESAYHQFSFERGGLCEDGIFCKTDGFSPKLYKIIG